MNRRTVISGFALSIIAAPLTARAQQPRKMYRIGLLSPFSPSAAALWHEAFRQGLREHGWIERQNVSIEYRYAEGRNDRLPDLAADLVRLKVDVIVASITTDALVAKNTTRAIPIVMASAGDPVGSRLVESLARPGGNITGLSQIAPEMAGKRLELLKEVVPKLTRVAVLWNPTGTTSPLAWKETQVPARALSLQLDPWRPGTRTISPKRWKTRPGQAPALSPSCRTRCSPET